MATTMTEDGDVGLPSTRSSPPEAQSLDGIETRLGVRRRWVRTLRRQVLLTDALLCCVAGTLLVVAGVPLVASLVLLAVLAVVSVRMNDASSPRLLLAVGPVLRSAAWLTGLACVVLAVLGSQQSGGYIFLGSGGAAVVLTVSRLTTRLHRSLTISAFAQPRRLVVGDPESLAVSAARRARRLTAGEVIPVVTRAARSETGVAQADGTMDQRVRDTADDLTRRGPTGLVERIVRTALDHEVDRVTVIPGDTWRQQQLRQLSWLLEGTGIDMVIATQLDGIAPHRVAVVQEDGGVNVLVASASPRGFRLLAKELVDRVGAAVLLVLFMPLMVAVAVAVRLDSPGAPIFRQVRVRAGGATFVMLKFRTMRVDAEQVLATLKGSNDHGEDGPLFKMTHDPRITRVGQMLRKTSLDELPQLINVVKGEMSLIGPRPALPVEVATYDYVARRRLAVKPGMTGLWQVSGRSRLTWDESIRFDLDYVDNWSPATDAAIAVRTIRAVVTRDGAY